MAAQNMIRAAEHVDFLQAVTIRHPEKVVEESGITQKWKPLEQKLVELYMEESKRHPAMKNLKTTSHLLDKLVEREGLNTLVINLYPGNEGYSLMLKGKSGIDTETIRLPYEESELLDYIDAEELPPVLTDLLDRAQANLFYNGCVIVELRDYRRSTNNSYDTRYILLKPTPHSLLCDMAALTNDGHRWTQEDQFTLEAELLLHTSPPLCLDPSPSVFFLHNKSQHEANKFNTHALKRNVRKFSQASVNRKRKMEQCAAPKCLRLHDFISRKRDKLRTNPPVNLKVGKTDVAVAPKPCVDMWKQKDLQLTQPESVEVDKYASIHEKPKFTYDNTPVTVEEYTLETERSQGKVYLTRLTIMQRITDDFYLGELYVDRDFTQGQQRGSTCKFPLGTRGNVEKYIKQFTEIITEEGRRSVKITRQISGQPPTVTYTQTVPHFTPAQVTADNPQSIISQATQLAATINGQGVASDVTATGAAIKQPPKLTLQISAATSGGSSPLVSPQGQAVQPPASSLPTTITTSTVSNASNAQLVALQQQQLAQRAKQLGNFTLSSRTSTSSSSATTLQGKSQLPTYSQATGLATAAGIQAPPPQSPTTPKSRRSSLVADGHVKALPQGTTVTITQGQIQSTSPAPQTPSTSASVQAAAETPTTITGLPPGVAGLSLANLASLGPGLSLQNLQNIPGLHVSLANVTVTGNITMPVPLGLMSTTSTLTSPTGILINSVPGITMATRAGSTTATSTTSAGAASAAGITSPSALVTMGTVATTTGTATSSTAGSTTVLSSPSSVFSLPINMPFMTAANLKNPGNIRLPSLLQIPGQQQMQLVSTNLPAARAQLAAQASLSQAVPSGQKAGETTPVTAGLLSGPLVGRPGAMVTTQQLMQLSTPQQLLALKHQQLLQLQQQQQAQQQQAQQPQQQKSTSSGSHTSSHKSKSKKRSSSQAKN